MADRPASSATGRSAADDPTHFLDGWRAPARAAAPELPRLHTGASAAKLAPERLARLRERGYEMTDVEDVELVEIQPPRASAAAPLDTASLGAALARAAAQAGPTREPDEPRLLARWQPAAWIVQARRLCGATAEVVQGPSGPLVENRAPQWLLALWPPQRLDAPLLGRWPQAAALVEADDARAGARFLIPGLPAEACLWLADLEADWALVAELVLHHEPALRRAQAQALRDLLEAEQAARFVRLNDGFALSGRWVQRRPR